jgi:hypothetical protein
LWNDVALRLSPKKRVFLPGGLLTGFKEDLTLKELRRLYSKVSESETTDPRQLDTPLGGKKPGYLTSGGREEVKERKERRSVGEEHKTKKTREQGKVDVSSR